MSKVYEACQNVRVSGQRLENLGAPDGIWLMVQTPFAEKSNYCATGNSEEAAIAELARVVSGICSKMPYAENCQVEPLDSAQVGPKTSLWAKFMKALLANADRSAPTLRGR
jgi:hypothetical protein